MNRPRPFLTIAILIALCACRGSRPDTVANTQAPGRTFVDLLAAQLEAIHYRSIVMRDGEALSVRIGSAPAPGVRRAICHTGGWPSENRMVRLDDTLRRLHQEGVTRLQIIGDSETMDVQINQQGKCEKRNAKHDGP